MSVEFEQAREKFESVRDRVFDALGVQDKWRDCEGNASLKIGRTRIPGTAITIVEWRDCWAGYEIDVDQKWVRIELTAGWMFAKPTREVRDPQSVVVVVAGSDAELKWTKEKSFGAFADDLTKALAARARRL